VDESGQRNGVRRFSAMALSSRSAIAQIHFWAKRDSGATSELPSLCPMLVGASADSRHFVDALGTLSGDWRKNMPQLISLRAPLVLFAILSLTAGPSSKTSESNGLKQIAQVALPGAPVRFDYQSLDLAHHRLYIAHMNANQLVVFDTNTRTVAANLDGFPKVHGVWAIPELGRVYASSTGDHNVTVVDMASLRTVAKVGPVRYPDGLAYAPDSQRVFVSDEHGDADAVIDAPTNSLVATIPLGGGAGNTVYDPGSKHVLVAVHGKNELAVIDPATARIINRHSVDGIEHPHGIALDVPGRLAFVAGEGNNRVALMDLTSMHVLATAPVGKGS
jgi:hypothetical protein